MVRAAELMEAEGRLLRAQSVRVGLALALMLTAGMALLGAVGLFMAAIFAWLMPHLGIAGSAAICGVISLGVAGILFWASRSAAT